MSLSIVKERKNFTDIKIRNQLTLFSHFTSIYNYHDIYINTVFRKEIRECVQ